MLRTRVRRVAAAGRLRVSEARAVAMVHAAGTGAVTTLLAAPAPTATPASPTRCGTRCPAPSSPTRLPSRRAARTVAFRATAAELPGLSDAEKSLLEEWLQRSIEAAQG